MFFRIQGKPRMCEVFFPRVVEIDGKTKKEDMTLDFMKRFGYELTGRDENNHLVMTMNDYEYWKDVQMLFNRVNIYRDMLSEEKKSEFTIIEENALKDCKDYKELRDVYENLSDKVQELRA